jgi:hypothetical protein
MCNKRNTTLAVLNKKVRVDACLSNLIEVLDAKGMKTLASCCGHGKYNMSIVFEFPKGHIWELLSGVAIPRTKRFYVKDKEGYYYIPEVVKRK